MLSIIESTSASPTDPLDSGLSQCSGGPITHTTGFRTAPTEDEAPPQGYLH